MTRSGPRNPITIVVHDPRVDLLTIAWSVGYADAAPGMLGAHRGHRDPVSDLDTLIRSKQTGGLQDRADRAARDDNVRRDS